MKNSNVDIVEKINQAIGNQVRFQYPTDEGDMHGVLVDRAVMISDPDDPKSRYWDVVDLIEFPGGKESQWIRIGYYRREGDNIRWASRATITEPIGTWKRLLIHAAKEKRWFRELLEEVMNDVKS